MSTRPVPSSVTRGIEREVLVRRGRTTLAAVGAALLAAGVPARAADGRFPVYQPTTISQPGSYHLTRDISGASGEAVITIGSDDVTLDLGGHTITALGNGYGVLATSAWSNVRVTNGRIRGGLIGIYLIAPSGGDYVLESLMVSGSATGISISSGQGAAPRTRAVVRDCRIEGATGDGIYLQNVYGGTIERNVVIQGQYGIRLSRSGAAKIADNHVSECSTFGIVVEWSASCTIAQNSVESSGSIGIYLYNANDNSLDWNRSTTNGTYGLYFNTSTRNVYSYNRLLANPSGNYFHSGNFSAGGNNAGGANF